MAYSTAFEDKGKCPLCNKGQLNGRPCSNCNGSGVVTNLYVTNPKGIAKVNLPALDPEATYIDSVGAIRCPDCGSKFEDFDYRFYAQGCKCKQCGAEFYVYRAWKLKRREC